MGRHATGCVAYWNNMMLFITYTIFRMILFPALTIVFIKLKAIDKVVKAKTAHVNQKPYVSEKLRFSS